MNYLLMCCFDESRWNALPQGEREEIMKDYGKWIDRLTTSGQYVGGGKLEASTAAASISANRGRTAVTDGPFAETKEQLGGYHILDCHDRDEALALAAEIPTIAAGGKIEVRPMQRIIPGARTR